MPPTAAPAPSGRRRAMMRRVGGQLPRELGLQVRMAVALAMSGALLLAAMGALGYVTLFVPDGWSLSALLAAIIAGGAVSGWKRSQRQGRRSGASQQARHRVERVTQRLAVLANAPEPKTMVLKNVLPLSWTFAPLGGTPTIHVTTGLLNRLEDRELQAVVAHELGHLLHRDALVVTLLAGPPAYFFAGLREVVREDPVRGTLGVLVFLPVFGPPALVMLLISRLVCRHRELAADRAAALLTGSPAAVAAALMAVDDDLRSRRQRDLRRSAAHDAFHFVPVRAPRFLGRLWATHPPLRRRVARLQRLEAGMHT